jgi:uncharacterized protein YjbI with pentapeptide repeats
MAKRIARELDELAYYDDLETYQGPLDGAPALELALFEGLELDGVNARGSRLLECAFSDTVLSGGSMKRARLNEVWMRRTRIVDVDLAETSWHDVTVLDSSIAALECYGSRLRRVALHDCKLDSVNFRESELIDVEFSGCVLRNVDLMGATLKNVSFPGSTIEGMELAKASLSKADFSGARELGLASGAGSLRGAILSVHQLMDLAPALAAELGITLR